MDRKRASSPQVTPEESISYGDFTRKLAIGAVLAGLAFFFIRTVTVAPLDVTKVCLVTEDYHIHPHLTIIINGTEQIIPKGVGFASPTCIRPLHTHEEDGVIHVEYEKQRDFTLGEFFRVWGQEFNRDQIFNYRRGSRHDLILTVNGQPSDDWENLVLVDQQKIVINYLEKKP